MFRSIATLVLFVWICCHTQAEDEKLYKCVAWGDPHLTRFPSNETDRPGEVWCQESGWQKLLDNKHVLITINVSVHPYVINEFNLVIKNDVTACVLTSNSFSQPPKCGEDIKITITGNSMVVENKKNYIIITIAKYSWNERNFPVLFDIHVSQSSYLIHHSTGLCRTGCDPNTGKALARRQRTLTDIAAGSDLKLTKQSAENICETLISAVFPEFKISSLNRMDLNTRNSYSACLTDVQVTGDKTFAKVSVQVLVVNEILDRLTTKSDFGEISKNIIQRITETNTVIEEALPKINPPKNTGKDLLDVKTVEFDEDKPVSISCRKTWAGIIKILSAKYQARSDSCSINVTKEVAAACVESPRLCTFKRTRNLLQTDPCFKEPAKLVITYGCEVEKVDH